MRQGTAKHNAMQFMHKIQKCATSIHPPSFSSSILESNDGAFIWAQHHRRDFLKDSPRRVQSIKILIVHRGHVHLSKNQPTIFFEIQSVTPPLHPQSRLIATWKNDPKRFGAFSAGSLFRRPPGDLGQKLVSNSEKTSHPIIMVIIFPKFPIQETSYPPCVTVTREPHRTRTLTSPAMTGWPVANSFPGEP